MPIAQFQLFSASCYSDIYQIYWSLANTHRTLIIVQYLHSLQLVLAIFSVFKLQNIVTLFFPHVAYHVSRLLFVSPER